jgi:glycosyltransferase involved in cell wall biosynthesis
MVLCTAMTARPGGRQGSFVLTRKFVDGVLEYVKHWPGPVSVWVERTDKPGTNLDHVETHPDDVLFELHWLASGSDERFMRAIESADLVLAALVDKHVSLAELCRARGVPLVFVTEYSVKTRQQIVRTETRNPLVRWRRQRWTTRLETRYERAVALAAGVQCNGLPTYKAYSGRNPRSLLYFDTRVRGDQLVSSDVLEQRLSHLRQGKPLRLAFSGRLIAMKGADHLPLVARELRRLNVPFTMDICGGGALEAAMREAIARFELTQQIRLRGVLDFERELLPFIAREIDLFVCCHRQGDPSCTYLETYSCGVPIVGYDNEAFAGLAAASGVGGPDWVTPMDDPVTLARKIADLGGSREGIAQASHNALAFATRHTFEHTMCNRVQHMLDCLPKAAAASQRSERSA